MTKQTPNIVVIFADDMGYGDLSCLNADANFNTPNMDRVAAEGMTFTDAHANSAVCTPTRYGILTGRYCWRSWLKKGVLWGFSPPLIEEEQLTLPGFLQHQGYRTACVGKWHLGMDWTTTDAEAPDYLGRNIDFEAGVKNGPVERGFDYYFGISASNNMPPYCFIENSEIVGVPSETKDPVLDGQHPALSVPGWDDQELGPTLTQKACEWLHEHKREHPDQPFFLYMPSQAPHRPCVPPDQFRGQSNAGKRGDMVLEFDWTVGQIRETLENMGELENTLLIVTSDNGARCGDPLKDVQDEIPPDAEIVGDWVTYGHNANHIYRGEKADIWDGGHRIPFLISWPGQIPEGQSSAQLICLTDCFATVAELIGCSLPAGAGEDSTSFANALGFADADSYQRRDVIHHSSCGLFAIRDTRWKLVSGLGSGGFTAPQSKTPEPGEPPGQLYDMLEDPSETTNVYFEYPEIVKKLHEALEEQKAEQ